MGAEGLRLTGSTSRTYFLLLVAFVLLLDVTTAWGSKKVADDEDDDSMFGDIDDVPWLTREIGKKVR